MYMHAHRERGRERERYIHIYIIIIHLDMYTYTPLRSNPFLLFSRLSEAHLWMFDPRNLWRYIGGRELQDYPISTACAIQIMARQGNDPFRPQTQMVSLKVLVYIPSLDWNPKSHSTSKAIPGIGENNLTV